LCVKWQSRRGGIIHDQAGLNPKHEIRNSKQSQMTKFSCQGGIPNKTVFRDFEFRKFEFVLRQAQDGEQGRTISDFDIRILDFLTPNPVWFGIRRINEGGHDGSAKR
jgi:hypothetical protein